MRSVKTTKEQKKYHRSTWDGIHTWVRKTDVFEDVVGDLVTRRADAEPYAVPAVGDGVVVDAAVERLEESNASVRVVVNGVPIDLGIVGAAVEEDTNRPPVIHRIVVNLDVVAALRRNDTCGNGGGMDDMRWMTTIFRCDICSANLGHIERISLVEVINLCCQPYP